MVVLNRLDRKILYEIGNNARATYKEIATKIKSKKPVVAYHVNSLEKNKVIWKYVPVFSLNRMGVYTYKIFFKLHGLDKENEEKIIQELVNNPEICWVAKGIGTWDLMIATYVESLGQFTERKNKVFNLLSKYIQEYAVTILEDALVFNRDYLIDRPTDYRKEFVFGGKYEISKIDETQKQILRQIYNNGKYTTKKIAEKTGINPKTAVTKIKDLERKGIIQGYTTFIRVNNAGIKFAKINIYLTNPSNENLEKVVSYAKLNKNVLHLIKSIGDWELELELEAEETETINEFIRDLKTKFPDTIKKIELTTITNEAKLDFFPAWY